MLFLSEDKGLTKDNFHKKEKAAKRDRIKSDTIKNKNGEVFQVIVETTQETLLLLLWFVTQTQFFFVALYCWKIVSK